MTKSNQFEIISRDNILQNYGYKPDIFSELQKCDNSDIKQFCDKCEKKEFNYKKNPNLLVTVITEEFPKTLEYYKIQLFLSQLFKDIADDTTNKNNKEVYEKSSEKYLEKAKKTQKICVSTLHVSYQVGKIYEKTDEKIIECAENYQKYSDPNFLLTQGNLESINNTKNAIEIFKEGTKKFMKDKRFSNNLANMYLSIQDFDAAKKYYNDIEENLSANSLQQKEIFYNNIGCMYVQMNDIKKAEFYFNKAIRENPKNYMVWHNEGIQKIISGDMEGAERNLEKSYKLNKDHQLTGINYVQILIKNGNKEKARSIFKRIPHYVGQNTKLFEDIKNSLENYDDHTSEILDQIQIRLQISKLKEINRKLTAKQDALLKKVIDAQRNNKSVYEKAYAAELYQVRKMKQEVSEKKLSMEQIKLRLETQLGTTERIKHEMEQTFSNLKESDSQLFQRIVKTMQKSDVNKSRVLSNELSEIRKKEKLIESSWETVTQIEHKLSEMDGIRKDKFKNYLEIMKQIRTVACIQKLIGEKSTYESLVNWHNKIFQITEDKYDNKLKNNLDSTEIIKIANHKLKLNKNNTDALEMLIFAYFDLNEMTNAAKYFKKLVKIQPENKNSWANQLFLSKKNNLDEGFSNILKSFKLENNLIALNKSNNMGIL